jgi:glycosyltransferase involved in cell wall biosynthesis
MKTIVFITDTWSEKNLNGVVTWMHNMRKQLEVQGFRVVVLHPGLFFNFSLPADTEIKIAPFTKRKIEKMLHDTQPSYIHIATSGLLGFTALKVCKKHHWTFTTFYHTRFPEYLHARFKVPNVITYQYLKWFHNAGARTGVGTESIRHILEKKGFHNLVTIPLGIDVDFFKKNQHADMPQGLTKPIFTYLGRLAPEKNVEAFLKCDLPGSKLVIGSGVLSEKLKSQYRNEHTVRFVGHKDKTEIVDLLSISDVFVFPSKTDTFGLTIVEALACGVPVAAYDVPGPQDIITSGKDGYLGENLEESAKKCLDLKSEDCVEKSRVYSWKHSAELFIKNLVI